QLFQESVLALANKCIYGGGHELETHYTGSSRSGPPYLDFSLRRSARQHTPDFAGLKRLRQQIVSAQVDRLRPKSAVGPGIGDHEFSVAGTRQIQQIAPGSVLQIGFRQNDRKSPLFQSDCSVLEIGGVHYANRGFNEHQGEGLCVVRVRGDEEYYGVHAGTSMLSL